ncbi:MAG TPA: phosphoglycerate kinase, partial [Methylomirabilota bacterium]|nr:phosphoglycerate kinase [Methylomirabilota bacterium]
FARSLAGLAQVYVNDAFAAAHRAHASTEGIARHLKPAAAGLLMARELDALGRIFERPERPLWAVLGGAKVSDKLGLVEHLLDRVDGLAIGGGMAFTFLKAMGHGVGRSLLEPDRLDAARAILERARTRGIPLRLPVDVVAASGLDAIGGLRTVAIREIPDDLMGLDIGPATVIQFAAALKGARTIIWNGPMGVFEKEPFAAGTLGVGRAVADSGAFSVIGGGDTIAAVQQAGVMDRIGYVSTAGGAFLEFLEGRVLPGVAALDEAP